MGASVSACFSPDSCSGLPGSQPTIEPLGAAQRSKQNPKKALIAALLSAGSANKAVHVVQSMLSVMEDANELVAFVNASNSKGQTAIALASDLGFTGVVELLLQQGANPWKKNNLGGRTPLHLACLKGKADTVRILLEDLPTQFEDDPCDVGTRFVDARSVSGFTALHFATRSGDPATIQAVLAHDPNITASSNHDALEANMNYVAGTTPLHIAAAAGNLEAACALMRHYAMKTMNGGSGVTTNMRDPRHVTDSQGRLPWNLATGMRRSNIVQALHPSVALGMFLPEIELLTPCFVPSLKSLAAAALKQSLLASLDRIPGLLVANASSRNSLQLSTLKPPGSRFCCLSEETTPTPKLSRTAIIEMWEEPDNRKSNTSFMTLCAGDLSQAPLLSWQDTKAEGMSSSTLCQFSSGCNSQLVSFNGHAGLCEICFDSVAFVRPSSCHHAVCRRCAKEIVANIKESPLACPFCRTLVQEFTTA